MFTSCSVFGETHGEKDVQVRFMLDCPCQWLSSPLGGDFAVHLLLGSHDMWCGVLMLSNAII